MRATPFLLRDSSPQQWIQWPSELNSPIPIHFSLLIPKMLIFNLVISCLTMSNGHNISGSYTFLFFIVSDFTFTNRHIQNWASFSLWPSLFILSGAISPLFFNSILETYWPGDGAHLPLSYLFAFSYCSWGSWRKNTGVVCYSFPQWTKIFMVIANTLFQQHKKQLHSRTSPDTQYWNQIDYILCCWGRRHSRQSGHLPLIHSSKYGKSFCSGCVYTPSLFSEILLLHTLFTAYDRSH